MTTTKRHIVSMSGGKDSVATWLWARRSGLDPIAVYLDTGWEHPTHYPYLAQLEATIGPIIRVGPDKGFEALARDRGFPGRVRRWCTEELKLFPFARWLAGYREHTDDDVCVLLGIRREESTSRATAREHEWSDLYDCSVWRPILDWTVSDVMAELHRAGVPVHPLYLMGAERVGCYPCVNAGKRELRMLTEERIAQIEAMERDIGFTMFSRDRRTAKRAAIKRGEDGGASVEPISIRDVVTWSRTERGGKRIALVQAPTGCARWGVCDPPAPAESL